MSDATKEISGMPIYKALLLTLPMALLVIMMVTQGRAPSGGIAILSTLISSVFLCAIFFLMLRTGETDKYRSLFFIIAAICFVIQFTSGLIETRGSLALTRTNMIEGNTPFCHLVIPMTLIPAVLSKTIIFPGTIIGGFAPIAGMMVLWLGASLAVGRGWCSWVCFFGGLDEGFSRLRKKPLIEHIDRKWTYLPHAVLLGGALTAALTLSPTYCEWLCPFKAVTEFEKVTSLKILFQTFTFIALFLALVIVLPILTRKRIQCGLFCPFASFQSFTNKANVFDVRIDWDKCTNCGHCISTCPTFSLDETSVQRGRALLSCTKCGHCVDHCPQKAVSFHIKGVPMVQGRAGARLLFLYPAFIFGAAIGGGSIMGAVTFCLKFLSRTMGWS